MADMIVSGAGTSSVNTTYVEVSLYNGKPSYIETVAGVQLRWTGSRWEFYIFYFPTTYYFYYSTDDVDTPDLCTTWQIGDGALPIPTVTAASSSQNLTLTCAAGSYSLTGTNADFYRALVMACEAGTYALTGTNADLTVTYSAGGVPKQYLHYARLRSN